MGPRMTPLTQEEIEALRAEFARLDEADPLMEFFTNQPDEEDADEDPASRDNLYYAP